VALKLDKLDKLEKLQKLDELEQLKVVVSKLEDIAKALLPKSTSKTGPFDYCIPFLSPEAS
jgi:hypothetical protein